MIIPDLVAYAIVLERLSHMMQHSSEFISLLMDLSKAGTANLQSAKHYQKELNKRRQRSLFYRELAGA